jgi:hypothetical protein
VGLVVDLEKGIRIVIGPQDDVAAVAAIAAVGAAEGDVFFPPEAGAAVAAVPALDVNLHAIHEFMNLHRRNLRS